MKLVTNGRLITRDSENRGYYAVSYTHLTLPTNSYV